MSNENTAETPLVENSPFHSASNLREMIEQIMSQNTTDIEGYEWKFELATTDSQQCVVVFIKPPGDRTFLLVQNVPVFANDVDLKVMRTLKHIRNASILSYAAAMARSRVGVVEALDTLRKNLLGE